MFKPIRESLTFSADSRKGIHLQINNRRANVQWLIIKLIKWREQPPIQWPIYSREDEDQPTKRYK